MLLDMGRIADIDEAPYDSESPFPTAVRMRKCDIAQCLLEHDANINCKAVDGYNFFHGPACKTDSLGACVLSTALECINFLLQTRKILIFTTPRMDGTIFHALARKAGSYERENALFIRKAFESLNTYF